MLLEVWMEGVGKTAGERKANEVLATGRNLIEDNRGFKACSAAR
jgi:hypothetical protein